MSSPFPVSELNITSGLTNVIASLDKLCVFEIAMSDLFPTTRLGIFLGILENNKASLFVQPRDEKKEIWEGRRIGVEQASTQFPVDEAYSIDDLDEFHPDRFASRILGMGDVISLVERAQSSVDKKTLDELEKEIINNDFTFIDFQEQINIF